MNWRTSHKLDQLYQFEACCSHAKDLLEVSNQVIHSYIFELVFSEDLPHGLSGILVCSDRNRNKYLYHLNVAEVIALFEEIGENAPAEIGSTFNLTKTDYDVKVGPSLKAK